MCAACSHLKHLGHVGFAQPRRDPEAPAGTLRASAAPRTGAAARRPISGGCGAAGRSAAREHLQNKGSGPALIWKRPPPPPPPALARPALTHLVLETHPGSRVLAPRTLTNPEEPLETTHPAARGGGRGVPGIQSPSHTRPDTPGPSALLYCYYFSSSQNCHFNAGKGASRAHV